MTEIELNFGPAAEADPVKNTLATRIRVHWYRQFPPQLSHICRCPNGTQPCIHCGGTLDQMSSTNTCPACHAHVNGSRLNLCAHLARAHKIHAHWSTSTSEK